MSWALSPYTASSEASDKASSDRDAAMTTSLWLCLSVGFSAHEARRIGPLTNPNRESPLVFGHSTYDVAKNKTRVDYYKGMKPSHLSTSRKGDVAGRGRRLEGSVS